MSFTTSKLTEVPLRSSLPFTSRSRFSSTSFNNFLFFSSAPKRAFHVLRPLSSLRTKEQNSHSNENTNKSRSSGGGRNSRSSYPWDHQNPKPSAPWLDKWPSHSPSFEERVVESNVRDQIHRTQTEPEAETKIRYLDKDKGQSAIERIVLRLRNLGLGSDDEDEDEEKGSELDEGDLMQVTGEEKLGDLLKREWVRPDTFLAERERDNKDEMELPWERSDEEEEKSDGEVGVLRKRRVNAPTLAELTIEDTELRRLRRMGMYLRERINVPKAGITQAVLEKIHDKWRKEELVRLKFHEVLARDMKTAHEIVERRTRGLVIWRSGSVMVVYRGSNYQGPSSKSQSTDSEEEDLFIPDVYSTASTATRSENITTLTPVKSEPILRNPNSCKNMTEEEAEYNSLLDGLGPRFHEWWGTGVLPVDADLLPPKIPGYKTPFRLLPTGMRSRLTNAEMTNLRKVAKSLPCHFALGRNRNHQGLAAAIIKLWEKSLVAKIAVKRGIQNTNNKLMADELKTLTGGVLLLRNKYYIVIYRGKDFLPPSVAAVLAERQQLAKEIQNVEEKVRSVVAAQSNKDTVQAPAGTLAEFYEAQARWGRDISPDEREKMLEEASRAQHARLVKRIEHKLALAQAKKLRAERLLAKIEASMIPSGPDYDQETITDEERVMFRRVGLRMKAYLPLGIRGVFDGVIENMHLHWKHRELVKLITKQKTLAFVEDTARLLEYESGGILVAIERVPKGYALIYYRGKNYRRPISLRPRNLLTKAKALKRSVAMQRHEALSQHISQLEGTIEQMKKELGVSLDLENETDWISGEHGQSDHISELTQSEDECMESDSYGEDVDDDDDDNDDDDDDDDDDEDDIEWQTDEESVFSALEDENPLRRNG